MGIVIRRSGLTAALVLVACGEPGPAALHRSVVGSTSSAVTDDAVPGEDTFDVGTTDVEFGSVAPVVTESGLISWSADACGSNAGTCTVQVLKPAGATLRRAFIAAASTGFSGRRLSDGDVRIDGNSFAWGISTQSSIRSWNHWAEVTSLIKSKIDAAPAGRVDFSITEVSPAGIDGVILAAILDDPSQPTTNTAVLLFGAQLIAGDTFNVALAEPLDKTDPALKLDFSLGISYGYQPSGQRSLVDVNGRRLTSSAGGQDDGAAQNGALITVGGLDDTNASPTDPNSGGTGPRYDDELYDLLPFVNSGEQTIRVFTTNPSNDDNIFFAGLYVASAVAVVGEGIILAPTSAEGGTGTTHTVTANLQDDLGRPIEGRTVSFQIAAGPNAGDAGSSVTDASGQASFMYTGDSGAGIDEIKASFVNSRGVTVESNTALMRWILLNQPPVAQCVDVVRPVNEICVVDVSAAEIGSGSYDPDGGAVSLALSPDGPFGLGATPVTMTAMDTSGLTAMCAATVTAVDVTAPAIFCPEASVAECTGAGAAVVSPLAATATDNCRSVAVANPPAGSFPLGTTQVEYAATDGSGNVANCASTIVVVDTIAPAIVCPSEVVAECTGAGGATVDPGAATAVEVCTSARVDAPGSAFYALGTTTVEQVATDEEGNTASCASTVSVEDTTPPAIVCPAPIVAECANGGADVIPGAATASEMCTASNVAGPSAGRYALGTTEVNYTATDESGNASTCASTISVVDTTPPAVTSPGAAPIWPPNHKYRSVSLSSCGIAIADACSGALDLATARAEITCVTSDEVDDARGDGRTVNDIEIVDATTVSLRAERQGESDGRVYRIGFRVTDAAGNSAEGACVVDVPHDEGRIAVGGADVLRICR